MTSTPDGPAHDGSDLEALRAEIDALRAVPSEELLEPTPKGIEEREPVATPTDAIGSEKWDEPVQDESLDQE